MKVLHVSSESSWRGGEQQIAYLLQECRRNGVQVEVLARDGSAFQSWALSEEFNVHGRSFSGLSMISTAVFLKQIAKEYDLLHVHSGKGHDVLALAFLLGLKTPSVISRRVDFPVKDNAWASWKYNHPMIKRFLCVSDAIRELVKTSLKSPEKAITVHSGVDLERYSSSNEKGKLRRLLNLESDIPIIGVLSALAPHKDLFTFIDSCVLLHEKIPKMKFVILGEGELKDPLETYRNDKGLRDHLFMPGFRKDALALLSDLSVFMMSSKTEGLGTSIIDAMASGLPVVATRAGGIPELVLHEKTGILVDIGDALGLANGVINLLESHELRARYTYEAKLHIKSFSYQETARKTMEVYEEACETGR